MKRCLVLGSAACLWDDIDRALDIGEYDAVIAAKQAGIAWPGDLYGWVSLHPDWMGGYKDARAERGFPPAREIVSYTNGPHIDRIIAYKWPDQTRSGSSGGVAVKYAIEEGFEKIVLCGIPMDASIGRIDGRKRWTAAGTYQVSFKQALPYMQGKCKSVSGWTMKLLGAPTPQWLEGKAND